LTLKKKSIAQTELSVADGANGTATVTLPPLGDTVMSAGHTIDGLASSTTLTTNVHVALLFALSNTMHETGVGLLTMNREDEAGVHTTPAELMPDVSVADGAGVYATIGSLRPSVTI
jgi:hypothetical protein